MITFFTVFICKERYNQYRCVTLERIYFRILWPKIRIIKPYIPRSIFAKLELVSRKPSPTKVQLDKISKLGESVGLQRNEIIAAVDAPIANQGITGEGRSSIFIPLILVSILAVVSALLIWAAVDPDSFPFHVYTPGTFYGTIRPQDFSSHSHSPLIP